MAAPSISEVEARRGRRHAAVRALALSGLVLAACAGGRDLGCATRENACRQQCRSLDAAGRAECEARCAAENPCRAR